MLYTVVNFTTQCGENRNTDIVKFAILIHTKKWIHCVVIFTIRYGNYFSPDGELYLIYIGKFARRTWVNFTQQYGKNHERSQQNTFHYAVWQLLLYFYREFPSKILSVFISKIPWISIQYVCQVLYIPNQKAESMWISVFRAATKN